MLRTAWFPWPKASLVIGDTMAYKKKTWKEKLEDDKGFPKTIDYSANLPCGKALKKLGAESGDSVVLAPAREVYEIMSALPRGTLITLNEICSQLAGKRKTDYCCPLTTGIFVMTVANAIEEGRRDVPYWRTIKSNGELNEKYPGGAERHKKLLEKEGFRILRKGKKYIVEDFQKYLGRRRTS
jgi:alkylated DNA nucleotide flippase Atl1